MYFYRIMIIYICTCPLKHSSWDSCILFSAALICFHSNSLKSRCWTLAATRSPQTAAEAEFSHDVSVAKHDFPKKGRVSRVSKAFLNLSSLHLCTEMTKDERAS